MNLILDADVGMQKKTLRAPAGCHGQFNAEWQAGSVGYGVLSVPILRCTPKQRGCSGGNRSVGLKVERPSYESLY